MEDQDLKYVQIYEKYFIYAISFGITDKVETEFNQKQINNVLKTNFQILLDRKDKVKLSEVFQDQDLCNWAYMTMLCSLFLMPIIISIPKIISGNIESEGITMITITAILVCIIFSIFVVVLVKKIRNKNIEQFQNKINKK